LSSPFNLVYTGYLHELRSIALELEIHSVTELRSFSKFLSSIRTRLPIK
jgi:hypothetical protein